MEETILRSLGYEKIPNCECMFVHRKQGLFLSVYVDDIKMAGKKWNMAPMWKKWMKHVDVDEPTSFLAHVYCKYYTSNTAKFFEKWLRRKL